MALMPRLSIQKREDLRDQTYYQLRKAILGGPIRPGTILVQGQLADQLGISRTPVREALDRLASEGLVIRSPGGRMHVAPFSLEELREKYAVRKALETLALRLAAPNLPGAPLMRLNAVIDEMRAAIAENEWQRVIQAGVDFHDTISIACGSTYLRHLLSTLSESIRRYRQAAIDIPGRADETLGEHVRIVQHLVSGDIPAAERAMEEHIARSQQRLEQDFQAGHLAAANDIVPS